MQAPTAGVETADQLWSALTWCAKNTPSCSNPQLIKIKPGFNLDLGSLDPAVFPLVVERGVEIRGDYELFNIVLDEGKSMGTRIFFPWLYEYGQENTVADLTHPSTDCDDDFGSAFKLLDHATITKICLYGPRTDTKDWRWGIQYGEYLDYCAYRVVPPREGINSGILVTGNACTVSYCEIYGFGHFGVQVRDMLFTNANGAITNPTDCYELSIEQGSFYFNHNYVHNCKAYGFGYGLYISSGSGIVTCELPGRVLPSCTTYVPPRTPPYT